MPAYGRQEVAVLQGGRPGLQVLRAPHAPRPQPFKKACGNAARAPVPTAGHRGRLPRGAPGCRRQRQQLPKPLPLPCHRWQHRWMRRSQQHVQPVLRAVGVVSAADGQCRQLRSSWWWNGQGSQATVHYFLFFHPNAHPVFEQFYHPFN